MASDASTHQLVGYVTKMFPTFGYINNEIFFQRKCVIGPMVEVGDNVATSAVYQPNMPIKWSAEKVWKVQDSTRNRAKDDADGKKHWADKSPRPKTPEERESHTRDPARTRDLNTPRNSRAQPHSDRKRPGPPTSRSGSRGSTTVDRSDVKRRRLSPVSSIHSRSSPKRADYSLLKGSAPKCLLNERHLIVPDILARFPTVLSPVDLYRIICHWQDSFTLLKPFYPDRSTVFQILGKVDDSTPAVTRPKAETGFYVNVLLLSMPSMPTLQDKTTIRAESSDHDKAPLRKYIKLLALSKTNERFKAIGGPWNPDLDGEDPTTNSQALINAAIRICKEQIGLDLSHCSQWHRFLEFRYSRTEGSTARPTSVLFPGSQLWGRSVPESANNRSTTPSKPYHRIVVYFVPDIWSLMPSTGDWAVVKKVMENALSRKSYRAFPISQSEMDSFSDTTSAEAPSDNSKSTSLNPITGSTIATAIASGDYPTIPSTEESLNNAATVPKPDQLGNVLDTSSKETNDEGLQSPTRAGAADKDVSIQEGVILEKTPIKSPDEMNLSALKVSELREQLKVRNLPADGIKSQLLSRLKTAVEKEVEQARKEEEERKKKEKELQDALAAKEEEDRKRESLKPVVELPETPKSDTRITLRNYPSIIVQKRLTDDYTLQTISLDSILESKSDFMDARSYELIICAHSLFDMVRRDSIFTLFRALVTAGDRGIQAKSRVKSNESATDSKTDRSDNKDQASAAKEVVKLQTIDLPLLCACTFLDTSGKGYFYIDEAEDMIVSLGLPVSRYQVRSLVTKVAEGRRIYYRSLTDVEMSPSTLKGVSALSEIDDDEYLFELIRGGDAILDEQKELAMPTGSVLVLRVHGSSDAVEGNSKVSAPASEAVIVQQIAQLEAECFKLKRQLKCKTEEIDRLRVMTDQISTLKDKLASANQSVDDLRRRLRGEYERMHSAYRVIEQQANSLDASRSALRQAANRLRGRENESATPSKKSTTEQKVGKREHAERKGTVQKTDITTTEPKEETQSTEPDAASTKVDNGQSVDNEPKPDETIVGSLMDVSVSVVPLSSPKMVNGLEDTVKDDKLPESSSDTSSSIPVIND